MAKVTQEPEQEGPRSFAVLIRDMADGEAEAELSYQLHELCKRMQEEAEARQDKVKGAISLQIRLVTEPKGFVGVSYEVTIKAPKRKTSAAMYWMTKGGNLSPDNPKQQKLPLREVAGPAPHAREVAAHQDAAPAREV